MRTSSGQRQAITSELSIGEFARRAWLSAKALRRYDEMGLLVPARVEPTSGYRFYREDQVDRARLIAALRQLDLPLAEIATLLDLEPPSAAVRLGERWASAEATHSERRRLVELLCNQLQGRNSAMYDVTTRQMPSRSVLWVKRNVDSEAATWAFGKEFISLLRGRNLPKLEGRAGAMYCIFWGEVGADSDGPLEWCMPVPDDRAEELAALVPELQLRTEPAHCEGVVDLGLFGQAGDIQSQVLSESLRQWAQANAVRPLDLGVRMTYLPTHTPSGELTQHLDFAVPYEE